MKSWNELSKREQLESTLWDAWKDAYGYRPRQLNMSEMTDAELEVQLEACCEEIGRSEKARVVAEEIAAEDVEHVILNMMMAGAKSREMAIRWLHEANDTAGDEEFLCYTLGLPYGYFKKAA